MLVPSRPLGGASRHSLASLWCKRGWLQWRRSAHTSSTKWPLDGAQLAPPPVYSAPSNDRANTAPGRASNKRTMGPAFSRSFTCSFSSCHDSEPDRTRSDTDYTMLAQLSSSIFRFWRFPFGCCCRWNRVCRDFDASPEDFRPHGADSSTDSGMTTTAFECQSDEAGLWRNRVHCALHRAIGSLAATSG